MRDTATNATPRRWHRDGFYGFRGSREEPAEGVDDAMVATDARGNISSYIRTQISLQLVWVLKLYGLFSTLWISQRSWLKF